MYSVFGCTLISWIRSSLSTSNPKNTRKQPILASIGHGSTQLERASKLASSVMTNLLRYLQDILESMICIYYITRKVA